jgi:short-subunit dehydrogenase
MKPKLRSLKGQVAVVTGAWSGIGHTIDAMAAKRGASVVLASRSEMELNNIIAGGAIAAGSAVARR